MQLRTRMPCFVLARRSTPFDGDESSAWNGASTFGRREHNVLHLAATQCGMDRLHSIGARADARRSNRRTEAGMPIFPAASTPVMILVRFCAPRSTRFRYASTSTPLAALDIRQCKPSGIACQNAGNSGSGVDTCATPPPYRRRAMDVSIRLSADKSRQEYRDPVPVPVRKD